MSAAAAKRTVLAAASILLVGLLAVAGIAGGASKRDRVPPTDPGNPHVTAATPSLVFVTWEPALDDVALAGYLVYGDEGRATVSSNSYVATSLGCGESSELSVIAVDKAGNRSSRVPTTIATAACPDVRPPSSPSGFRQAATTQTSIVLAWDPATDETGVVGYGVYRSLARIASTAEPTVTLSGLSCGQTYEYKVDAVDAAGNRSSLASAFVTTAGCADAQPPSEPTNLTLSARTTTSVTVTWSPSSDNVAVAGYRVSVDGAPRAAVSAESATISALACGATYRVAVDAFDASGNRSTATSISAATDACAPPPGGDTTPPSAPTGVAASGITQTGMTLSWYPSTDAVGVTGYDVFRNGVKVDTPTGTSSIQSGLGCSTAYAFAVAARDAAGNVSQQTQLNASTAGCTAPPPPADTTAPSTPPNPAISTATRTSVTLSWGASTDNVGVIGYRTYVNGAAGGTTAGLSATIPNLACGTAYTFEVDAYDLAGNMSGRASVIGSTSTCADSQAPTAPSNVSATSRTATSIALGWTASTDNVGVVGYGLYKGGVSSGASTSPSAIFSGLTCNTSYTLAVDAYDAAGNRSPKSTVLVSTTACPDTTPPTAPTGVVATGVSQTGLTLAWNASTDNVGVTGYDVYRGGTKLQTVTTTTAGQSGLACATSYSFGIAARDAAGNSSSQATLQISTSACSPTSEWTFCSNEDQQCSFTGARDVRYGASGTYTTPRSFTDGVMCSNGVFGDPLVGVTKRCETRAASGTPPPPAPPPSTWSPPITITQGGTYSGSWESTTSAPAVRITTTEPVVIENSRVRNLTGGRLIVSDWPLAVNLTLRGVQGFGGDGYFIELEGHKSFVMENCTLEKTSGVRLNLDAPGSTTRITRNRARNIQTGPGYLSAFVKFNWVRQGAAEISWNEVINEYNNSHPEDIISLINSANVRVHNNYLQHNSTPGNAYNTSSQGTITLEQGSHDNVIYENQMVDTVNGVYFGPDEANNVAHHNRLIQDGLLPDGSTRMGNGYSGMSIHSGGVNNRMHDNVVGYVNRDGQRIDWWPMDGAPGGAEQEIARNTTLPNPISSAAEQNERTLWLSKLAANGITVGA